MVYKMADRDLSRERSHVLATRVTGQLAALVHGYASMCGRSVSEEQRLCLEIGVAIHGAHDRLKRRPLTKAAQDEWAEEVRGDQELLARLLNKLIGRDVPDELLEAALPEV